MLALVDLIGQAFYISIFTNVSFSHLGNLSLQYIGILLYINKGNGGVCSDYNNR